MTNEQFEAAFIRARIRHCEQTGAAIENSPNVGQGVVVNADACSLASKAAADAAWCANKTNGWLVESLEDSTGPERVASLAEAAGDLAVRALRAACEAELAAATGWSHRAWDEAYMAWRNAEECIVDAVSLRRSAAEKKAARAAAESAARAAR